MGGPQSPDEDREAFPYYDPQAEIDLIQKPSRLIVILLGSVLVPSSCLLLMAREYEHSPEREIGVYPVTLTPEGLTDPHVGEFGETLETGHWHGDMPGLTEDAVVLATSQGCPRQMIRFSPKHYAFQAHLEFDPEAVDLLIAADGEDGFGGTKSKPDLCSKPEAIRDYDYREMNAKLFAFWIH